MCLRSLVLSVFVSLLLMGCARQQGRSAEAGPPAAGLEEPISLLLADSLLFRDGEQQFWLRLQRIDDNRCPLNVTCITGGKASVLLQVQIAPEPLQFCIGSDCREQNNSTLVEYNNERYTIVLEEVRPYPQQGSEQTPKQAIFKIKRATS
ncbi:hypothetical protein [Cesiribacter andamanensis]|nr:hypothetical protein [Cesiribacter andamanensis]